MSLIVRCPVCKTNNEMEESYLDTPTIECPSCKQVSYREDFSVMTFCPHCHQKLAIPLEILNADEILCATCDKPFKPNSSISLNQDDLEAEDTIYQQSQEPKQLFQKGDYFDKYEIIALLGRGGMGEVYLAKHLLLNKKVAIKIMLAKNADKNPVAAKRFIREAKLANKIQSPNIIGVFDVGIEQKEKHLFIAMEYVDGLTLTQIMKERGTFTEQETLNIAREVCNALLLMEANKIVHRDIKPSNIMINSDQAVKLADLGIAKADSASMDGELTLTVDNLVFGTPNYASPEQCRSSHNTDTRSDIYSLGATMFHMVAGRPPFDGVTPMDTMFKVINEPPLDITTIVPHLSIRFKALLISMLAKDPANRPQSISELISTLEDIINNPETLPEDSISPTLNEVTSNDYRTSLTSFIKKIDRFKTLTNFTTVNETISKALKIANTLTKIAAAIAIIVGVITIISLILGVRFNKDFLYFFNSKKTSTQPQAVSKTDYKINIVKPTVTPKKPTYYSSNTKKVTPPPLKKVEKTPIVVNSLTLSPKEFNLEYENLFFGYDKSINSIEAFSTIENRLNRSKKILSSSIIAKYKDKDKRFNDIYKHHLKVANTLQKQFDTYKQRKIANANRKYSSTKTLALVKLANELFATKNNDWNKNNKLAQAIVNLLKDNEVDPNVKITIPIKVWNNIEYLKNPKLKLHANDQYITLPLPELVLDDQVSYKSYCYSIYNALLKREITPEYVNGTRYSNYFHLGINNLGDKLLNNFNSTDTINSLLSCGDNPNRSNKNGEYILNLLTRTRDIDIIKKALYNGVKINTQDQNGETALFNAVRYSTKEIKALLLNFGINFNLSNKDSKKAKDYVNIGNFNNAIANKDYHQIKKLITHELAVLPLYDYKAPILHAINNNDLTLLNILIEQKIDLNSQYSFNNNRRFSPLEFVNYRQYYTRNTIIIIDTLIKNGANIFFNSSKNHPSAMINYYRNKNNIFYSTLFNHIDLNIHLTNFFEDVLLAKAPYVPLNRYQTRGAWELFIALLDKTTTIDFDNTEYLEKLPKLLGSLQVDEKYLELLDTKGYNFDTVDSNNKNVLDYFLKNLIIVHKLTPGDIANIDYTLRNKNSVRMYHRKYKYLKSKNLTFDENNLFDNSQETTSPVSTTSTSNDEKVEEPNVTTKEKAIITIDIKSEEQQANQLATIIENFSKIHKEIFDNVSHPDNFTSVKSRLSRTRKILSSSALLYHKDEDTQLTELYNFQKKIEARLVNQLNNKEKRQYEIADYHHHYNYRETNHLKKFIEEKLRDFTQLSNKERKDFYSYIVSSLSNSKVDPYVKIHVPDKLYNLITGNNNNTNTLLKGNLGLEVELVDAILKIGKRYNYWNDDVLTAIMRKKIIYPEKTPLYLLSNKKINYPEMSIDNFQDYIVNAAKYQRLNDLTFLLESGDNVNQSDKNGNTVLHYLVRHRSPMAKEAIYAGAEINKANKDGETPYFWAVRYGTVETRAMLLSLGANPDILNKAGKKANEYNYVTSFNDAVRNKDYKVMKSILVNYPSLVNDFLYNGLSLVGFAIVNKNNELLKLLLNYKANPNIFGENSAVSTLGMIWNNNRHILSEEVINLFKLLLSYGGDVTFSRFANDIPVLYSLYLNSNRTYGETVIYNMLVENFKTSSHLVPLLSKIYYPFDSNMMRYNYYNPRHQGGADVSELLKMLISKSTPITNNDEIRENMPKILGSLKVNLDTIIELEKSGLDLTLKDSNDRNILDYFCMYFEKTYPNLRNLPTNYANYANFRNRPHNRRTSHRYGNINSNRPRTVWDNYKEKVSYLRKKGLQVNESLYNISDNFWKDWE